MKKLWFQNHTPVSNLGPSPNPDDDRAVQVIKNLSEKQSVPEGFDYVQARSMFTHPKVLAKEEVPELKWKEPDVDELVKFMCDDNGFDEKRIRNVRVYWSGSGLGFGVCG